MRHSGSSVANIRLKRRQNWLELSVSDEGKCRAHDRIGVGLSSMRERVEALGGCLRIDSLAEGTTVTAGLPVKACFLG